MGEPVDDINPPFPVTEWLSGRNSESTESLSGVFQVGHVEGEPARRGVFPVTFVHFITD